MHLLKWTTLTVALAAAQPVWARNPGPGVAVTCEGGTVTKRSYVVVTNGPPAGTAFVPIAEVGADAATVCRQIKESAEMVGKLKAELETETKVVIYGSDVRLVRIPEGIKIRIEKF